MMQGSIQPSYIKGIARLADLNGNLDHYQLDEQADAKALKQDWEMVGQDLWQAVETYEQEQRTRTKQKDQKA